jgi:hypothetical protein
MTLGSNSSLGRTIGWRTAAAIVIANMIGTGIFTTSGFIARDTGSPWILLALWVAPDLSHSPAPLPISTPTEATGEPHFQFSLQLFSLTLEPAQGLHSSPRPHSVKS